MQQSKQVSYEQAVEELQFSLAFFSSFDELVFSCNTCVKADTGHDLQLDIKDVVYLPHNDTFMFCLTYKPSMEYAVTSNNRYLAVVDYLFKSVFTRGAGYGVESEDSSSYLMKFNPCTVPVRVMYQMQKLKGDSLVFHREIQLEIESKRKELLQDRALALQGLIQERKQLQERIDFIDRTLYNTKEAVNESLDICMLALCKEAPSVPFNTRNYPEFKYRVSTQDLIEFNKEKTYEQ